MPPMPVVKRRMSTIKQHGKGDNVWQKPFDITQLFKNNNLKMLLKAFSTSTSIMTQIKV
jgi:hypothetical protein